MRCRGTTHDAVRGHGWTETAGGLSPDGFRFLGRLTCTMSNGESHGGAVRGVSPNHELASALPGLALQGTDSRAVSRIHTDALAGAIPTDNALRSGISWEYVRINVPGIPSCGTAFTRVIPT